MTISLLPIKKEFQDTQQFISTGALVILGCKDDEGAYEVERGTEKGENVSKGRGELGSQVIRWGETVTGR